MCERKGRAGLHGAGLTQNRYFAVDLQEIQLLV